MSEETVTFYLLRLQLGNISDEKIKVVTVFRTPHLTFGNKI